MTQKELATAVNAQPKEVRHHFVNRYRMELMIDL
jgi:hypothetical protein